MHEYRELHHRERLAFGRRGSNNAASQAPAIGRPPQDWRVTPDQRAHPRRAANFPPPMALFEPLVRAKLRARLDDALCVAFLRESARLLIGIAPEGHQQIAAKIRATACIQPAAGAAIGTRNGVGIVCSSPGALLGGSEPTAASGAFDKLHMKEPAGPICARWQESSGLPAGSKVGNAGRLLGSRREREKTEA